MLYYLSGNRSRPLAPPMVFNDTDREFILSNKTIILQSKKKLMERSILRATRFKHTSRECPFFFLPPLLSASLKAAGKNSKWTPADAQRDLKARTRQNFPIHITRLRLMSVLAQIDVSVIFLNSVQFFVTIFLLHFIISDIEIILKLHF